MPGEFALTLSMWAIAVLLWSGALWVVGAVVIQLALMWKGE
jgi:hypothetical protein